MAQEMKRASGNTGRPSTYSGWQPDVVAGEQRGPSGWTVYASVMLALAGIFGIINGLIALFHDEVYVVGEERIVAFDFTQWGWVHLIGGGVVLLAALALSTGALWARIIGVIVASLHALAQVAFIEAYPFWSLTIIALDILVIYGCVVGGKEPARA